MNKTTKRPMGKLLARSSAVLNINMMVLTNVKSAGNKAKEGRYLVYEVLQKEGYTPEEIAKGFNTDADEVSNGLAKLVKLKADYRDINSAAGRLETLVLKAA